MNITIINSAGFKLLIGFSMVQVFFGCSKNDISDHEMDAFAISSPQIGTDSLLPVKYTCDGESATLPLEISNKPSGTVCFALIMYHIASPDDIHWYWILYNIPATTVNLPENVKGIGELGTNSVNDQNAYSPPCSKGPGIKCYTYTLYALSDEIILNTPTDSVNREYLLNIIHDKIIDQASMSVYYSRVTK